MNPTQPQMDAQAIALAKAIRKTESNDNFEAKGKSGEFGAYQFMPKTWKAFAKESLGDENAPMTPANQNAVAYTMIKKWKDQGLNPAQIAAKWNSGSETGWENKIGKNSMGVEYNVPKYVKSVTDTYQQFKMGNVNAPQIPNPSTVTEQPQAPQSQYSGALGTNPDDSLYGKILDNSITRGIKSIFPGEKIGEAIGTLGGYAYFKAKDAIQGTNDAELYDLSAPTPLQAIGDVAQGALMVGTGMPAGVAGVSAFGKTVPVMQTAKTALGRIGQLTGTGAAMGATGAIAEGGDLGDVTGAGVLGSVLGGGAGVTGELIGALFSKLPEKIMNQTFKAPLGEVKKGIKTGEDTFGKQVLDHGVVGTNRSVYLKAIEKVKQNEDSLQDILQMLDNAPAAEGVIVPAGTKVAGPISKVEILPYFKDIVVKLKNTPGMGNEVKMVQKVFDELPDSLTFSQANVIKRNIYDELGNPAYKIDANLSTKREAMKTLARAIKDTIEKKSGASKQANSIVNHFNRELAFWGKLRDRALTNMAKGANIGLKDLGIIGLGEMIGNTGTGFAAEAVKQTANTTIAKTAVAQTLNKISKVGDTQAGKAAAYAAKTGVKLGAGNASQ